MPPPKGYVFGLFGLKTGLHFAHFGPESGMVFEETTGVYERTFVIVSFPNESELNRNLRIRNAFKCFFFVWALI